MFRVAKVVERALGEYRIPLHFLNNELYRKFDKPYRTMEEARQAVIRLRKYGESAPLTIEHFDDFQDPYIRNCISFKAKACFPTTTNIDRSEGVNQAHYKDNKWDAPGCI